MSIAVPAGASYAAVLDASIYEMQINSECSDVHTAEDIAADVVEALIRTFQLAGFNRDDILDNR